MDLRKNRETPVPPSPVFTRAIDALQLDGVQGTSHFGCLPNKRGIFRENLDSLDSMHSKEHALREFGNKEPLPATFGREEGVQFGLSDVNVGPVKHEMNEPKTEKHEIPLLQTDLGLLTATESDVPRKDISVDSSFLKDKDPSKQIKYSQNESSKSENEPKFVISPDPKPSFLRIINRWFESLRDRPYPINWKFLRFYTWFMNAFNLIMIIWIPFVMAWSYYIQHHSTIAISLLFDASYAFWIYLRCNSMYRNEYGNLVMDMGQIYRHFIWEKRGWISVFATFPWELFVYCVPLVEDTVFVFAIESSELVNQCRVAGCIRFARLMIRVPFRKMMRTSFEVPGVSHTLLRLIKTFLLIFLVAHIDTCLFWTVETSLPEGSRWIDKRSLIKMKGDNQRETVLVSVFSQYLITFLSCLQAMVLKLPVRQGAKLQIEQVYINFEFLIGLIGYCSVFGNIHSIIESFDQARTASRLEERHNFEMRTIKAYLKKIGLPPKLQDAVVSHKELQWRGGRGLDEENLFKQVPKLLQHSVRSFLYMELIKKCPLFSVDNTLFYDELVDRVKVLTFVNCKQITILDGLYIYRMGDEGQEMFFIIKGSVKLFTEAGRVIKILGAGDFFGERIMFGSAKRIFSSKAVGTVELCMLKKSDFEFVLHENPTVIEKIRAAFITKAAEEDKQLQEDGQLRRKGRKGTIERRRSSRSYADQMTPNWLMALSTVFGKSRETSSSDTSSSNVSSAQTSSSYMPRVNNHEHFGEDVSSRRLSFISTLSATHHRTMARRSFRDDSIASRRHSEHVIPEVLDESMDLKQQNPEEFILEIDEERQMTMSPETSSHTVNGHKDK